MRILDLALKDLVQIVRDWKSFFFLLAMPIAFTLVFGFAFGGFAAGRNEETDPRLPVGVLDRDQSAISQALVDLLAQSDAIRPVSIAEATAEELNAWVDDDELAAMILIPAGYGDRMRTAMAAQRLDVILKPESNAGITAQNSIRAVVSRLVTSLGAAQFSTEVRAEQQPFADDAARQAFLAEALAKSLAAWESPPFTVRTTQPSVADEEEANAFSHSSPGMMIQFAIAGLIGSAEILVVERKSRSLQRLLTTATSRLEILVGHFLAMFLMILLQFAILIGFAAIFLNVAYFSAPLATLLVAVATAFFVASLGMLIGTLAQKEEQVIIYSLVPMFLLSALGGAWTPLEFTSSTFQTVGHFTPMAWAMDGFRNIIVRGLGLQSVLLPAAVLFGFGAACFALAAWRFKFE